jgi:uncharacterized tellurite resistance protein B-like protein
MHILLGLLGTIVTLLVLLHRLADVGIDLGGLNPFSWRRRRAWRQKFEANPIFALHDPREIAAVLLVGVAKIDGDWTASEKRAVLDEFERTFSMTPKAASELLASTVYLLGDMRVVNEQLDPLLDRFREQLDTAQVDSLLAIIERIAAVDGGPTSQQRDLVGAITTALAPKERPAGTWTQ